MHKMNSRKRSKERRKANRRIRANRRIKDNRKKSHRNNRTNKRIKNRYEAVHQRKKRNNKKKVKMKKITMQRMISHKRNISRRQRGRKKGEASNKLKPSRWGNLYLSLIRISIKRKIKSLRLNLARDNWRYSVSTSKLKVQRIHRSFYIC